MRCERAAASREGITRRLRPIEQTHEKANDCCIRVSVGDTRAIDRYFSAVSNVLWTEEIAGLAASAYGILFTSWEHRAFQLRSLARRNPRAPRRL
jgi:hypothetical protein